MRVFSVGALLGAGIVRDAPADVLVAGPRGGLDNPRRQTPVDVDAVLSADRRILAFSSFATNLVEGDFNVTRDVFVRDFTLARTFRVSVSSAGEEGNGSSSDPAVSPDGRYVAFSSNADNLVPDDFNDAPDVFVHDLQTGVTVRVSVTSAGEEHDGFGAHAPHFSDDGQYVAFEADAPNLAGEQIDLAHIFVHDQRNSSLRSSRIRFP